ncbi:LOW QUALITY PROTEIN: hypothetical protein V2J09_012841 [Rumex salicifolius]
MHNASFRHELFPVWAYVLIYAYGGVDTITACDLSDNEQALQYSLHRLILSFWGGWLAGFFFIEFQLSIPLVLLSCMAIWNTAETLEALQKASISNGLPRIVEPLVQYMRQGKDMHNEMEADPISMKGYTYLVNSFDDGNIITTEDMELRGLLSPSSPSSGARSERLKDMSLSYAWFMLLLMRFAGFPLQESTKQRLSMFVRTGLLSLEGGQLERLFHIIEVELVFVYDFFYTKRFLAMVRPSNPSPPASNSSNSQPRPPSMFQQSPPPSNPWIRRSDDAGDELYVHHSDNQSSSLSTTLLDERSYVKWRRSVEVSLIAKHKIGFVNGSCPKPPSDSPLCAQWERCNNMVISWLLHSVKQEIADSVLFCRTARQIWTELATRFNRPTRTKLYQVQRDLAHSVLSMKYHGHSLEIGVTRVVMVIIATLEIWQIGIYLLSNWKILLLLCEHVKEPSSDKCWIRKENLIIGIFTIRDWLSRSKFTGIFLKPWKRTLGQYSFIQSYAEIPISRKLMPPSLDDLVNRPRVGQSGDFTVPLTTQVKHEIVSSFMINRLTMSPGKATLRRNELLSRLSYAYNLETNTEVILIWHIATSACESSSRPVQSRGLQHFYVANQISMYCAYLVTFAPELLPDHPYTAKRVFDKAVKQALHLFEGLDLEQRYQKMMAVTEEHDNNIVEKGGVLAKKLMNDVIGDSSKGWRVLAEFWAELLLYMTLSENVIAHGKHLAHGGEFITHLWTLLTHAGVVTPDSFQFQSTA